MQRDDVEQHLLHRYPDMPPGVVVAAVSRAARRISPGADRGRTHRWAEIEQAADEQLILRRTLRLVR